MGKFQSPLTGRGQIGAVPGVSGLVVTEARAFRQDTVKLSVQGAPWHYSQGGTRPLRVERVEFSIYLTEAGDAVRSVWVRLWGYPADPSAPWAQARRQPEAGIERTVQMGEDAPRWLHDLLREVSPPLPARAQVSAR